MTHAWNDSNLPDLTGRRVIVTGGNSGLGYQTALRLAERGAQVTIAVRSQPKGEAALAGIRAACPAADLRLAALDLADLSSVRAFAAGWDGPLDVLVNNAGVMAVPRALTVDGFERQLGTNHLGHFALTGLLLPALLAASAARVVTVSSLAALGGRMAFDDLDGARSYRPWRAYCQSKLANLLFTVELGRRLQASAASVLAVAAHPGYAATNLQATSAQAKAGVRRALEGTAMALGNLIIAQPAAAGALPSLYAATATGVVGGGFYGPQGPFGTRGAPGAAKLPSRAKDAAVAQQLWEISQQRTGVAYAELAAARA